MKTKEFEFFWDGPFSQWYPSEFKENNITYNCAEQYMMYQKAILFKDQITADLILNAQHPREQKKMGRLVKNYNQSLWDSVKKSIVYKGNELKFNQNQHLKDKLLKTQGILVEASPYDTIWGIGLAEDHPDATNIEKWKGQNLLGYILTNLRDNLTNNFKLQI